MLHMRRDLITAYIKEMASGSYKDLSYYAVACRRIPSLSDLGKYTDL